MTFGFLIISKCHNFKNYRQLKLLKPFSNDMEFNKIYNNFNKSDKNLRLTKT